ncbi:MAG: hypothetical protein LUC43_02240 [Burkholderiales bacterium]|nr:hypothetical protein [Burkholderiales bacterium]
MITDAMIAIVRVLDALIPKLAKTGRQAAEKELEQMLKGSYYMTLPKDSEE